MNLKRELEPHPDCRFEDAAKGSLLAVANRLDKFAECLHEELTMADVSRMYVEHIIARSKSFKIFNGQEFVEAPGYGLIGMKMAAMFAIGANLLETIEEGDTFVVVKLTFGIHQTIKFEVSSV